MESPVLSRWFLILSKDTKRNLFVVTRYHSSPVSIVIIGNVSALYRHSLLLNLRKRDLHRNTICCSTKTNPIRLPRDISLLDYHVTSLWSNNPSYNPNSLSCVTRTIYRCSHSPRSFFSSPPTSASSGSWCTPVIWPVSFMITLWSKKEKKTQKK